MPELLLTFRVPIRTAQRSYTASAFGRERTDGIWEGWVEFLPDDGTAAVRTPRETTQPNLTDLEYWATGLTPVYLEGALVRALEAHRSQGRAEATELLHAAPAPGIPPGKGSDAHAILDPFSVCAKGGEDVLRQQLHALSARHLRAIIRAGELTPPELDLEVLNEDQLVALIVVGVRARQKS